jgi:hypothetical protein
LFDIDHFISGLAFKNKNYYIITQNWLHLLRQNFQNLCQKRNWALWMRLLGGLILPTKKDRKIFFILSKFSVFCKIPQKFKAVFLWKIYRKKLQNSCQLAVPKNLCRFFFCVRGKICLFEISLYIQKTGFFSVFTDGRIKPSWVQSRKQWAESCQMRTPTLFFNFFTRVPNYYCLFLTEY